MKILLYLVLSISILFSCDSRDRVTASQVDHPAFTYLDGEKIGNLGFYDFIPFPYSYIGEDVSGCKHYYFELTLHDSTFYVVHADTTYNEGELTIELIEEVKQIIDSIPIVYLDKIYSIGGSHPQYQIINFNSTDWSYKHSIFSYSSTCSLCPREVRKFFNSIQKLRKKLALLNTDIPEGD